MPAFTHRTVLGAIEYTLERRTPSAPWSFCFWLRGKRSRVSTGCNDIEQAKIVAKKAIEDAQKSAEEKHGRDHVETLAQGKTLAALATEYLDMKWPGEENRKNHKTYRQTKSQLKIFCTVYEDADGAHDNGALRASIEWKTVRAALQRFIFYRHKTCGDVAATISSLQKTLSAWFSWVMQEPTTGATWGYNPAFKKGIGSGVPRLQMPELAMHAKPAPSEEAVDTYLEHFRNHKNKHNMYPLLVMMCSGTRPSGVGRIRWRDINLVGEPSINNVDEKQSERFIPLCDWAADQLRNYRAKHPPADEDCRVWPHLIDWAFTVIRKTGKNNPTFPKLTLGAIRRHAYTRLYQAGVPAQNAANIMGNSVRIAERHYVRISHLKSHKHAAALGRGVKSRNIVPIKAQA